MMQEQSTTNNDNYIINGGMLVGYNEDLNVNYFASVAMTGGTISGWMRTSSGGVTVNATAAGSLISANLCLVNVGSSVVTFNVGHNASAPYDLALSGSIIDFPGGSNYAGTTLNKTGPGLMVMSGSNTYVGPTIVGAGTLQIGNGTSGEALASGSISVSGGAVLAFNQADTVTISPSAGISGGGALVKFGPGTVELGSTSNTYSGGTTINGGVRSAAGTGSLPGFGNASPGGITLAAGAGVAVQVNNSSWTQANIDSVRTTSNFPAGSYFGLDTTGGNFTYSNSVGGIWSGGGGGLAKSGPGTLYLSNTGNAYTGGTLLAGGTLDFTSGALPLLSPNSVTFSGGALQWQSGTTDDISSYMAAIPAGITAGLDTNGNNVAFASGVTGGGGLSKLGAAR